MNSTATPHIGRKISRIRELRGMKQETLAEELGISQQSVSQMEQNENLEDEKLDKVAKALGVSKEAIKNFSEEAILNIIGNTYHVDNSSAVNYGCTFNPIDKIIEQSDKIEELYKKLLEAEKEKVAYLERLLDKK
ncbi:helix-turn-helix domain-containing protein [Zunongwangia profunda]|uniref:Lambda repressor-like DNA-binding protein n=1 Tax=Zunongwangia profunda (strain DSM 18752 / CCTCC AB 206139 / SM-A87) TaxID=655815 RepID=D5BF82_ZUNPS|nr:helix-turn-helix transcriptional regulator [Zunongwangia profunda]ADF52980.1 lambda repressor-like DNA-binding protein [Zunongwangia profunda SM-A87]MAS70868.1 XRE family transcriptional regulator [Zunongwangia sp.]|tara:strand:- start:39 stop:443 length:405 start_codon:yes stop_codon:yes gene_type:complete